MPIQMPPLSEAEYELILIGLRAISPSGGGSAPYTLFRKLCAQHGGEISIKLEQRATLAVLEELHTVMLENPGTTIEGLVSECRKAIANERD